MKHKDLINEMLYMLAEAEKQIEEYDPKTNDNPKAYWEGMARALEILLEINETN